MLNLLYSIVLLIPIIYYLITNYKKGIAISVMYLVLVPQQLAVVTGGDFPDFSFHRILLIVIILVWIVKYRHQYKLSSIPLFYIFLLMGITSFISLVLSIDFVTSFKNYLSLTIEFILFYFIVITSIEYPEDVVRILNFTVAGLGLVALIGFIEYYTRFNPVDAFVVDYARADKTSRDVLSTYQHRILLGTAMAMGWPLALLLTKYQGQNKIKIVLLIVSMLLMLAVTYFTDSRGAWLGAVLSGLIIFVLSNLRVKRNLFFISLFMIFVLMLRPGVWGQITDRFIATKDDQSFRGGTYEYRWALWGVAYDEISKSPERFLFGYGPGTTASVPIEAYFAYSDRAVWLWSWDNHYAAYLLEGGMVGLLLFLFLYFLVLKRFYNIWRYIYFEYKSLIIAIFASVTVIIFMMSNVRIFAPQLNFLTWTLVACAFTLMDFQVRVQLAEE